MSNTVLCEQIRRDIGKLTLQKRIDFAKMVYREYPDALSPKTSFTIISLEKLPPNMLNKLNNFIIDNISK